KPKNSLIKQFKEMMLIDGIKLNVSESAIEQISSDAIKLGDGARGLRTILENTMLDAMFKLPNTDIKSVTLVAKDKKIECITSQNSSTNNVSFSNI
ncbi:MAG TPA: hypothetical protein DCZ34_02195, partial [Clostridiales bacterium]|nr:hypothetical protein [Clostridiales bacterium]